MTTAEAILLGVVQGATEFLPVSSSAHLVVGQALLGIEEPGIHTEVALHLGTLVAILIVFWRDLVQLARDGLRGTPAFLASRSFARAAENAPLFPTAVAVVIGTVPVVVAGVLLEDQIGAAFESVTAAGCLLMVTGLLLLSVRLAPADGADVVGPVRGFAVGVAQTAALLPGISRSGTTIVAGRWLGLDRRTAGRYSFLLATPAMVGAAVWKSRHLLGGASDAAPVDVGALASGMFVSAVFGTFCLLLLLRMVERGRLHWFAAYCLPVGLAMALLG